MVLGAMSVCYTFTGNGALTRTGRKRYAATIPLRQRLVTFGVLATGFYVAYLAASVTGWLDRSGLAAPRSLASLSIGTVTVVLDSDALHVTNQGRTTTVSWETVSGATRFPDGVLLLHGPAIRWLPDSALSGSTADEAVAVIRSKIPLAFA
jgi:hypothetical protein